MTTINDIIKKKPYLAWYVKNPENLSEESVLEHVLNYGNWDDFQHFIQIKGIKETFRLFKTTLANKRLNYSPEIKAYFLRYLNNHI